MRGAYHLTVKAHVLDDLHGNTVFGADYRQPFGSAVAAKPESEISSAAREPRVQPLMQQLTDKFLIGKRADLGKIGCADVLHAHFLHKLPLVLERDDVLGTSELRKRGVAVEREHGRLQIPLCQRRAYDTDMP